MKHNIPIADLGPNGMDMANAVEACVHCGFCLPTCPTYVTMGEEMDSPRGRIFLMKEVLEDAVDLEEAQPYIDNCLGCLACVTSCPSGVQYGDLLTPFRAIAEKRRKQPIMRRAFRGMLLRSLPYPSRFRFLMVLGRLGKPFSGLFPASLRASLELLPKSIPRALALPEKVPARGKRRARVALLAGCAQQVVAPQINQATWRVLSRNGVEVVIPRGQACCGALAMHTGAAEEARKTARLNLKAFLSQDFDTIITNAAGCGSCMKEYPLIFEGEAEHDVAAELAGKVRDVSEFLSEIGIKAVPELPELLTVAYHDACHLAHAQGVRLPPRELLKKIPNLTLVEPAEWELCCGSAGTYNLEHPETASELGERKVGNLLATQADAVASGNIGCIMQIKGHLSRRGEELPVYHTVELLDMAYGSSDGG